MNARGLALCPLLLLAASCAAPSKEAAIQGALDAGKAARVAEKAACLVLQASPEIEREQGMDEYCAAILRGCPLP